MDQLELSNKLHTQMSEDICHPIHLIIHEWHENIILSEYCNEIFEELDTNYMDSILISLLV